MKACIYGAGAIGGWIGAQLAAAGCELSAVARGATLDALRANGLKLQLKDKMVSAQLRSSDKPAELGVQELVVIAVKAPALAGVARQIAPLLGPDTVVLTAMNGVPWWFFHGFGGDFAGTQLASIDADGSIGASIPARRVLGCVVHAAASVAEPGVVKHAFGNRLILGEPDGSDSERVRALAALLVKAGFDATVSRSIQTDIWYKLWGNMTMNPLSAITGATLDKMLDDALVNRFCLSVMAEAKRIGAKIGIAFEQTGEDRNAITRKLGAVKTSMLQDVEAGRPVELDALVSVVREIGQKVGEPTPNIDALLGLARLHAQMRGLYPQ